MGEEGRSQVVLLAMPEAGHVASMLELGKRLIRQTKPNSLTISILAPTVPFIPPPTSSLLGIDNFSPNLTFHALPQLNSLELQTMSGIGYYPVLSNLLKPLLVDFLTTQVLPLKAFVFDLIYIGSMIEVATQTSVPPYMYYTSNASMLGLILSLPSFDLLPQAESFPLPGFESPVPLKLLPSFLVSRGLGEGPLAQGYRLMLNAAKNIIKLKGIIINTLPELEPCVNDLFSNLQEEVEEKPLVYPVGPVLDLDGLTLSRPNDGSRFDDIVKWLDEQDEASVVFLCFGSRGAFGPAQVREIADGLELSGTKFLWVLRKPPGGPREGGPSDYSDFSEVLPQGFLERTERKQGLVCGWAPQGRILGHPSIGGFVSHCGWNSVLESMWCGVPILAWPMYAEQKLNAYGLVEALGLAHVVKGNYLEGRDLMENYMDKGELVTKEEVVEGIKRVMGVDSPVRIKVKDVSQKMRMAVTPPDGSSLLCLEKFIQEVSY